MVTASRAAQLLAKRVLPMQLYIAELREDKAVVARRLQLELGVSIAPVPVPLAPGDTAEQYEQRFLDAYPVYRRGRGGRGANASAVGERASRFHFARRAAKEFGERPRQSPRPPTSTTTTTRTGNDDAASSTNQKATAATATPSAIVMDDVDALVDHPGYLKKQFIELSQFRHDWISGRAASVAAMTEAEKTARYGVPFLPVFVPLARGESVRQYEARFGRWLATAHSTTLEKVRTRGATTERALWIEFAHANRDGTEQFDVDVDIVQPRQRDEREKKKETSTRTTSITDASSVSTSVQIRLDLRPKPTKRDRKTPTEDLTTVFSAKKPRHSDEHNRQPNADDTAASPTQQCSRTVGKHDPLSLDACMQCQCDACLVHAIELWTDKLTHMEQLATTTTCSCATTRTRPLRDAVVLDLTMDDEDDDTDESSKSAHPLGRVRTDVREPANDTVAQQLQRDFDELNELVVLNQQALDAAVEELRTEPPATVEDMTRLHDENEQLRGLLHDESSKRTAALALLILYAWRHDRAALVRMVHDTAAMDVDHVCRRSYDACLALAIEAAAVQQRRDTRARLDMLQDARRREWEVLIHFDKRLRARLLALLRRVHTLDR